MLDTPMSPPRQDHPSSSHGGSPLRPPPKPSPLLLPFFLKAIIMTLITSLFFLFLGIAAILLLHLFLAGSILHRCRRHHIRLPDSSRGLSSDDIQKLPRFRFGKGVIEGSGDCVICLDRFKEGQSCRKLCGCNHTFHTNCVDTWLIKVAACPICRSDVSRDSAGSVAVSRDYKRLWSVRGNV